MTGSLQTPLARLVLFMICLSVVGSVVAGVYYFAAVQPDQKALHTPINRVCDVYKCRTEANLVSWERDKEM
jgi:curli biogenesis system outer membrane secretion channel CsgG